MNVGDTFLSPSPSSPDIRHLYVVITAVRGGRFAVVNITSQSPEKEQTCILQQGDHPFLRHESVVNYGDARFFEQHLVQHATAAGLIAPQERIDAKLLERIQKGALASLHTELGIQAAVRVELSS